jgi:glutathione S-transferase
MSFSHLKSESYKKINPMGTSPAFQDEDLGITIWESGAVLDFLLERYDKDDLFHPAPINERSSKEEICTRAKYQQLKQYIIATVYPFVASMFVHSLKAAERQDEAYMEAAKRKWSKVFGPILSEWLGDGPYFLGEKLSAIDFLAAKPLNNAKAMGLLRTFPALEALFECVSSRPTFTMAYEGLEKGRELSMIRVDRSIIMVPRPRDQTPPTEEKPEEVKPTGKKRSVIGRFGLRRTKG